MKRLGIYLILGLLLQSCSIEKTIGSNLLEKQKELSSSDKTVIDNNKLEWINNNNVAKVRPSDKIRLRYANKYCKNLTYLNKNDWRLPTLNELYGLRDVIANFTEGIRYSTFWTSTSPKNKPKNRYSMGMHNQSTSHSYLGGSVRNSVLCTRNITRSEILKVASKPKDKIIKSNLKLKNPSEDACIEGGANPHANGNCSGSLKEAKQTCQAMGLNIPSSAELDNLATFCGATFAYNGQRRKAYLKHTYASCVKARGAIEQYIWTDTPRMDTAYSNYRHNYSYSLYDAKKYSFFRYAKRFIQCVE